jgi:hypothetical protein
MNCQGTAALTASVPGGKSPKFRGLRCRGSEVPVVDIQADLLPEYNELGTKDPRLITALRRSRCVDDEQKSPPLFPHYKLEFEILTYCSLNYLHSLPRYLFNVSSHPIRQITTSYLD